IIIKDHRAIEYGHKICLTTGASSLVTDIVVEKGNPADSTLATKMIERHKDLFGNVPRQATFDGGFATKTNLAALKALGVTGTPYSISVVELRSSRWRAVSASTRNCERSVRGSRERFPSSNAHSASSAAPGAAS